MDSEPSQEILNATYCALCKHGYADLTLQNIAAESDKSKALIHYHYESKNKLFVAFLDFLYKRYTDQIDSVTGETPQEHLLSLLETLLTDSDDAPDTEFQTAMLEVKAQAPYNDEIQSRLIEFDKILIERVQEIITAGIDVGEFDESVDPELAVEFLTTTIQGAHTRRVTVNHSMDRLHETVMRYVETHLATDGISEVTY